MSCYRTHTRTRTRAHAHARTERERLFLFGLFSSYLKIRNTYNHKTNYNFNNELLYKMFYGFFL